MSQAHQIVAPIHFFAAKEHVKRVQSTLILA
jgi:hypothetical protein